MIKTSPPVGSYLDVAYDSTDRLTQVTYPSGRTVDYTRNSLGQVASASTTANSVTTPLASNLAYLPFGPLSGGSYGNGLAHSRSFDQDYRLTALATGTVQSLSYTLNAVNNITAMTNTLDASRNQSFSYDALNRLTGASGIYGTEAYTYDANGNRLTSTINSFPETYTYDTVSHHLLQTVNGGTRNYSYDGNGNTTDNGNRQFTYGDHNRLKEAQVSGSPVATYTYNGRGERVKKVGTETTLYFYDQGGQLLAETDAFGNTLKEYLYVDGQPLAQVSNGVVYYVHTDHLGTPQLITDATQAIVWSADYTPFGNVNITTQTVTNNLRFPGQYFDAETNLQYNYFRDYDPSTGRYIENDPIGLKGGLNTYAYVDSNPLRHIDPTGQSALSNVLPWAGGAAVADGPLPIGDIIGGLLLGGALIYDLCEESVTEKCQKQLDEELERCDHDFGMWGRANHVYQGCRQRAWERFRLCVRNGGSMPPDAPGPWSEPDVDGWPTIHDKQPKR